jgi:5-formyltetrahydrofolate cyclo-ligase
MLPYYKNKSELRSAAKLEVKTISPEQKSSRSALIFKNILNSELIKDAKVVALYASLPDEVSTADIITSLHSQKEILLPRVAGDEMDFYRYNPAEMSIGAFGISEPQAHDAVAPSDIDVIIVPGVAFTKNGKRCGRGKGYYDKYLSREGFRATKIGVCFAEQIAEDILSEPHDIIMDSVIFG